MVLEDQDTWELGPLGPMPSISAATSEGNAVARPGATAPPDNMPFVHLESVLVVLGIREPRRFKVALDSVRRQGPLCHSVPIFIQS